MPVASLLFSVLAYLLLRSLWAPVRTRRGAVLFAVTAVFVHAAYVAARHSGAGVLTTVTQGLLVTWFVTALGVVLVGAPVRAIAWLGSRGRASKEPPIVPQVDAGRRQLLGMALPVAAASVGATGTASALGGFELRHEEIRVPHLPLELDGVRIGQLTDVHVGEFIDPGYLARAVAALDGEGVDLQVMTGDLVDDLDQLDACLDALEGCKAPLGMLAILGNHEKWRGEARVVEAYRRRASGGRLRLLLDQNVELEYRGVPVWVVGVDYPMRKNSLQHRLAPEERDGLMRVSADAAWLGVPEDEFVLCLTHHPDFFPIAAQRGAHLTLAGHTHGGQIGFFRIPLFGFMFQHILGRYRRGDSHLYVSAGTGHWLPYRVGIPAEVTVFTLRSA